MKKALKKKTLFILISGIILIAAISVGGYALYGNYQMSKIPGLPFQDALNYTLSGSKNAVITVGIIQNEQPRIRFMEKMGPSFPRSSMSMKSALSPRLLQPC